MRVRQTKLYRNWEEQLKDVRLRAAVAARLYRLANGPGEDVTPVGDGISELQIHCGAGYRIYFQRYGMEIIVLSCGGSKNWQSKDIARAKLLAKEWSKRSGD